MELRQIIILFIISVAINSHVISALKEDDVVISVNPQGAVEKRPGHNVALKDDSGCKCKNYNCGCCLHLELSSIGLNDTGCVNVSYLPKQYGISLTFDIDGHVFINETVSARNPPPICADLPHLKKYASICVVFHDLDISNSTFSGCIRLEARLVYVVKESVELGCFRIPFKEKVFTKSRYVSNSVHKEQPKAWSKNMILTQAKRKRRDVRFN